MSYLDELFIKYSGVSRLGKQPTINVFKQAVTEALEKQRNLILNKIGSSGWILNEDQMYTLGRVSVIISETKLEDQ